MSNELYMIVCTVFLLHITSSALLMYAFLCNFTTRNQQHFKGTVNICIVRVSDMQIWSLASCAVIIQPTLATATSCAPRHQHNYSGVLLVTCLWSRCLGLETYQRLVSVSSQRKLSTSRSRLSLGRLTSPSQLLTSRARDQFIAKFCWLQ